MMQAKTDKELFAAQIIIAKLYSADIFASIEGRYPGPRDHAWISPPSGRFFVN
jgi:hypothetical protein